MEVPAEARSRHKAFAEFVLPEVDLLYRVARSLTGQAADAEDLVQDAMVRRDPVDRRFRRPLPQGVAADDPAQHRAQPAT